MPRQDDLWRIRPAGTRDRQLLRTLLDDHLRDLSAFGPVDAAYHYFDLYFEDADRSAYVIDVLSTGAWTAAGFALVNRHACSGLPVDHAMAEFFILPDIRRKGVGARAASLLFTLHPGVWEVGVISRNVAAWAFWCHVTAPFREVETIAKGDMRILRFKSPEVLRRKARGEG